MFQPEIILTPDVKRALLACAHGRNDGKSPDQSRKKSKKMTDLETDYLGLKGERVTSYVFNTPFDERSYGKKGDTGIDIMIGTTPCAIKTNHRRNGYFVIERQSDFDPAIVKAGLLVDGVCDASDDHCLCVQAEHKLEVEETWRLVGWIQPAKFWKIAEYADWGYGPRWFVKQDQLLDIALISDRVPVVRDDRTLTHADIPW